MILSWRYIATKTCNIHEGDDERVEISEGDDERVEIPEEEDVTDKQVQSYISKLQTYVQKKPKKNFANLQEIELLIDKFFTINLSRTSILCDLFTGIDKRRRPN